MSDYEVPTVGKVTTTGTAKKKSKSLPEKIVPLIYDASGNLILNNIPASILKVNPKLVPIKNNPNPDCKKCYGRGHKGFNRTGEFYIPCMCMKPYKLKRV